LSRNFTLGYQNIKKTGKNTCFYVLVVTVSLQFCFWWYRTWSPSI